MRGTGTGARREHPRARLLMAMLIAVAGTACEQLAPQRTEISDVLNNPGKQGATVWVYGMVGQVVPDNIGSSIGYFTLLDDLGATLRVRTLSGFPISGARVWVKGRVAPPDAEGAYLVAEQIGGSGWVYWVIYAAIAVLGVVIVALVIMLLRPADHRAQEAYPPGAPVYGRGPAAGFSVQPTVDFVPPPTTGGRSSPKMGEQPTGDFFGRLVVESGEIEAGGKRQFELVNLNAQPTGLIVGRADDAAIQLLNSTISRHHAQFLLWNGTKVAVRNLSNRPIQITAANQTKNLAQNDTAVLETGNMLQLGAVRLRFEAF
ncbi:MAG: FHA domain-containing protein [Candidatus Schekmanbacteria bacterium]|nr:FHA domain-containing protein [Candidatus Schekmanbacteria bacterium]